jgi:hypothetical protein
MDRWFTALIPTRDSAAWIGPLLAHYQARNITPTILLDSRTRDETRAIVERAGAAIVDIPRFTHTEAIVGVTKDCVNTPWAFFAHDDEVPSDRLFERLGAPPPPEEVQSVAIPRRWAWYEPGKPLMYGRSEHWADRSGRHGTDHHWRLFRPDRVTYVPTMHSDGFLVDRWARVAPDAYIVHFEWVLRSYKQRVEKLRRYDEHRYGYGRFFHNIYLPEGQPEGAIEYLPFETHAYDILARTYFAARKPDTSSPLMRRSLRTHLARAKSFCIVKLGLYDFNREPADRIGLNPKLEREVPDPNA